MTLQELRDLVRTQMDMDETDLPNALLDTWLREGFKKAIGTERRWPFYTKSWSLSAVADTASVALEDDTDDIETVRLDGEIIARIGQDEGERFFSSTATGTPAYWSRWGDTLYLWPTPNASATVTVRGWREPTAWTTLGSSTEVDADERLHLACAFYALSMAYMQQEDEVLSARYMQQFTEHVATARTSILRGPGGVKVLGSALNFRTQYLPFGPASLVFNTPAAEEDDGIVDGGTP